MIKFSKLFHLDILLEIYLMYLNFVLISSTNEIYQHETSNTNRLISLNFAIIIIFTYVFIFIWIQFLIFSYYRIDEAEHNKLVELFRGVKSNKKSRHYVSALLLRRLIFVVVLIFCVSINSKVLIGILPWIQLINLAWIVFIRPYEEIKGNMI